ncbi:hypothetical protein LTS18_005498, partial [Coniosporium uncinatum]
METASSDDILLAQRIISAAGRHDFNALRVSLSEGSANVQDPTTGTSPLHAAVAACERKDTSADANGAVNDTDTVSEEGAAKTVEYLLQNGAIWNDLNKDNETPGCVAHRLGLHKLYEIMVAAGVRAELLFSKMEDLGVETEDIVIVEGEESTTAAADSAPPEQETETETETERPSKKFKPTEASDDLDDVSLDNRAYLKSPLRFSEDSKILLDSSDNA